ncbi:MAG: tRNA pseudouridine(13) synthase TruD [Planctomycetota bacterium]|jgi:tRNA pseudouridine13 synthase|nr:tRNA pseudouridine(13) synthase TruD [Planctomycetota bacterium]
MSSPNGSLIAGPDHFIVEELPAYEPCGEGEHVYVWIEKRNLTTDDAVRILARTGGVKSRDVGIAGRKDRRAVTRQWVSLQFGDSEKLAGFEYAEGDGSLRVLRCERHRNKLKTGHLRGNRFQLGLQVDDTAVLQQACERVAREGLGNRFGTQRFGLHGASLSIAQAWGRGDLERAVELLVDPSGAWHFGDELPGGFRKDLAGKLVGAVRKGANATKALKIGGHPIRKLIASAGQSAVFNAVYDARKEQGLLHRLRPGDLAIAPSGAPFVVSDEDCDEVNERASRLEVRASAPLPGTWKISPSEAIAAEERAWSADTGIDWAWFERDGVFNSPGDRRPVVVPLLETPTLHSEDERVRLDLALPSGTYATEFLGAVDIAVPDKRKG